jgi:hypothetical protein
VNVVVRFSAALLAAALVACGGQPQRAVETVVVCVWDSVDAEVLESGNGRRVLTPSLDGLDRAARRSVLYYPRTRSASGALASILTGEGVEVHGLRSVHELGAERVSPSVPTQAEQLQERGWQTLASVSEGHFDACGLARGFDHWHAPQRKEPRRWRSAREIYESVAVDLERALETDEPVFVLLHFGDLRDQRWLDSEPDAALLETYLRDWRHGDEVVDGAFDTEDEGRSLADRLRRALMRRNEDPRREALVRALYAGALAGVDAQLGKVAEALRRSRREERATVIVCGGPAGGGAEGSEPGSRHSARFIRVGDASLLDSWVEERSTETPDDVLSWPYGLHGESAAQGVAARCQGDGFDGLRVQVACDESLIVDWDASPDREEGPGEESVQQSLGVGAPLERRLQRRGSAFNLRLKHPDLFRLVQGDIALGSTSLADSDIPELIAARSPDWPENAIVGPVLDLQSAGQRRLRGRVEGTPGARVEVLVESFPADLSLPVEIECEDCSITRHRLRPGAVWVEGAAPLEFLLPPRSPANRLGVLVRVAGERVPGSRMRYLKRVLSAPDTLEFGFSAGVWLQPELHSPASVPGDARIRIDLLDELPPAEVSELPSSAELEFLRKLDPDE